MSAVGVSIRERSRNSFKQKSLGKISGGPAAFSPHFNGRSFLTMVAPRFNLLNMNKKPLKIFVQESLGSYTYYLGDPQTEIDLTYEEYIEEYVGLDINDKKAIQGFLEENEIENEETLKASIEDDPWVFIEDQYEMHKGPAPMFYWLMDGLNCKIDDLRFIQGDRPGSNFTYCESTCESTVKEVEAFLTINGYEVEIEILKD